MFMNKRNINVSIYKTNGNHALTDDFQIVKYKAKEEEIMASTLDSYVNREFLLLLHSLYYYLLTKYYIFIPLKYMGEICSMSSSVLSIA